MNDENDLEKPDTGTNETPGSEAPRDEGAQGVPGDAGDRDQEFGEGDETDDGESPQEVEAGSDDDEPQSRGAKRFQRLSNDLKSAKERADRLEQQLAQINQRLAQPPPPPAPKEPTDDEKALWPVERVVSYEVNKALQPYQQVVQNVQQTTQDVGDKADFNGLCATDTRAAKMRDEVEQFVAAQRQNGNVIPRRTAWIYLLGAKIAAGQPKIQKQREQAQQRVQRQQARPSAPRSDQSADRRALSEKEARNKRLEDATF